MTYNTLSDYATEFKAISGQINVDEVQGIVECFVSGIGNKDSVGDIVLPGAFTESLKRRKPRVVWGHDWNHPIGKVLEIYEVPASDPRLPAKMRQAGIGGLFARVQFNLKSDKGREAFANVAFYGMDQEWSIGYKTLDAIYDNQRRANLLREVELYEVSPVLHGANQLTGTISIKTEQQFDENDFKSFSSIAETQFVEYLDSLTDEEFEARFPAGEQAEDTEQKWVVDVGSAFLRRAVTNRRRRKRRRKSEDADDSVDSFRKSQWTMFDREFAARLKEEYPEIWAKGGNIKGNAQYAILTKIAEQGGVAQTQDQINALELREAWVARHEKDFRLPGVIAQIKWLAVGSRGEGHMKTVVKEAMKKSDAKKSGQKTAPEENDDEMVLEKGPWMEPEAGREGLMMQRLALEIGKRFGGPVRIRQMSKNQVIFDHLHDGKPMTMRVGFHYEDGQFMFGDPVQVSARTVYMEMEDGDEEGYGTEYDDDDHDDERKGPGCGCDKYKSFNSVDLIGDVAVKAGRVLSQTNVQKLQQAIEILQEVMAAGGRTEIEMKDDLFISSPADQLFDLKSFIDPVLEYHGVTVEVTEDGISVKSISGNKGLFIDALETAVKSFTTIQSKELK
jgi:HK97 family phage prohead protease